MSVAPASDVIIVGAGVVGLSTAYWLTKQGIGVTIVEQGPIPNPVAASADHHRLIRYPYGARAGYTARMAEGFAAWRDMWGDLPGDEPHYFADTGILCISQSEGDYTDISTGIMDRLGLGYERIEGADLTARLPFLVPGNYAYATLSEGGALMANNILNDLAGWLRAAGTQVLEHMPVEGVDAEAGAVTLADGRRLTAGKVVVTAGIATARLLPEMRTSLEAHRTVIVYATPPEELAPLYADMPCWNALGGDLDLWGMPSIAGLPMKLGNGAMGRREPSGQQRRMTTEELRRMFSEYALRFRGAERFTLRWHQANYWTAAPDHDFMMEQQARAYAVSACSGHGFKFGALSGRDVAEAVTGAAPIGDIAARMACRLG